MPTEWVTAEEFEKLTGSRGSVYIGFPPVRPKPPKKSQEVYLCPHCYELCTGSSPGIIRCNPCDKEWWRS